MNSKKLIVLEGPTAVGKTEVAVKLAEHLSCEIISSDSRQFYREMIIGTAKPGQSELQKVPHHFINSLSIHDDYNAGKFETEALELIAALHERSDEVILTGGSGLYAQAVCEGFDDLPGSEEVRQELNQIANEQGLLKLQNELSEKDPDYFDEVDISNPHRVIRALEVIRLSGQKYSELRRGSKKSRPFHILKLGLEREREELYQRIDKRVDTMMDQGLLKEARDLFPHRSLQALNTVGYKEIFQHLDGLISLEHAIELIKRNTRRFAKRQMTWLRKDKKRLWFNAKHPESLIKYIDDII